VPAGSGSTISRGAIDKPMAATTENSIVERFPIPGRRTPECLVLAKERLNETAIAAKAAVERDVQPR
jgi:hypothetical protein